MIHSSHPFRPGGLVLLLAVLLLVVSGCSGGLPCRSNYDVVAGEDIPTFPGGTSLVIIAEDAYRLSVTDSTGETPGLLKSAPNDDEKSTTYYYEAAPGLYEVQIKGRLRRWTFVAEVQAEHTTLLGTACKPER